MNDKWNKRFLDLAAHISSWSKDPSTKVGAVIVDPETKHVVSIGYNGFPKGINDTEDRLNERETKLHYVCHAELNAILNADRSVRGCYIYVYPTIMEPACCSECAKTIVQSGIKRVYGYKASSVSERWKKSGEYSQTILIEGNVRYISV
jgi:dCMP deaminase